MKNLSSKYDKERLQAAFKELGLTLTIRPHQVSTKDYHQLYKII
jgi:16S rRNA (adenine1518-N6/adenine1519-N6)-dimethyltransferase